MAKRDAGATDHDITRLLGRAAESDAAFEQVAAWAYAELERWGRPAAAPEGVVPAEVDSAAAIQEYAFMRTTLDLPDDLLKRAKIEAVERGVSLRELVGTALARELTGDASRGPRGRRLRFPVFSSRAPGSLELTGADLSRAEWEEDLRRHGLSR